MTRTHEAGVQAETFEWRPASAGLRFANLVIDLLAMQALQLTAAIAYGVALATVFGAYEVSAGDRIVVLGLVILVYLGYYVILEGLTGRTLGKLVTGTRVLTYGRHRPSFLQIVGRTLARLIPLEPFTFLGDGSGWHDTLSGTVVVKRVRLREDPAMREAQARMDARERELIQRLREP